jgi:phage terminase Nu1 subunit (DNA packaging protein)
MSQRNKSTSEIAEIFDVDESTVKRWTSEGLPSDKAKGRGGNKFDELEVAAWMKENRKTGKPGRPSTEAGDDLNAIKCRKELAMAIKYERQNEIEAGLLVSAAEVDRVNVLKVIAVRNGLCGMGASITPRLIGEDGPTIQGIIDGEVERILTEFSRG